MPYRPPCPASYKPLKTWTITYPRVGPHPMTGSTFRHAPPARETGVSAVSIRNAVRCNGVISLSGCVGKPGSHGCGEGDVSDSGEGCIPG
jgi:hypothetical protein